MAYKACLALIAAKRTDGLAEKVEVLYSRGKIAIIEYTDLIARLKEADA